MTFAHGRVLRLVTQLMLGLFLLPLSSAAWADPAAPVVPAAATSTSPQQASATIHVTSDKPAVVETEVGTFGGWTSDGLGGSTYLTGINWAKQCQTPCDVPSGALRTYRVTGAEVTPSMPFTAETSADARVTTGSLGGAVAGLSLVGLAIVGLLGGATLSAAAAANPGPGSSTPATVGGVGLAVGALAALIGVPLLATNTTQVALTTP